MKLIKSNSYLKVVLIALLWVIPVTSVNAQLSREQCNELLRITHERVLFGEKKYGRSPIADARTGYAYELDNQKYYKGECSPGSANYLRQSIDSMENYGRRCKDLGYGSNCGITSLEDFYSGITGQEISSSNQTQPNNDYPPPKKLTAAEQKRQNQQQKIEDKMSQSQQLAESTQAKADVARQGKRKTHDSAAVASQCIKVNRTGTYGSLDNVCNFKINYVECHYQPNDDYLVCEKQRFGAGAIGPNKKELSLVKNVEAVYWFACKEPAWPLDREFIDNAQGRGISARCAIPGTSN